jgi:plastocyanin
MITASHSRLWLISGVAIAVLGLAGAALAGVVAHNSTAATKVTVTEREYKLTLSMAGKAVPAAHGFKPGAYVFVAVDRGKLAHSLAISGPGIKLKRIPGTLKPGASHSLAVTLKQGTYKLWCPVPGHAALGMHTTVKVASGSSSAPPPPPPTSTGKGAWG